jgi:hypothetical protein
MSDELKQQIIDLGHYYRQHKLAKMVNSHPSFVAEDFAKLLAKLHKEIEAQNG